MQPVFNIPFSGAMEGGREGDRGEESVTGAPWIGVGAEGLACRLTIPPTSLPARPAELSPSGPCCIA